MFWFDIVKNMWGLLAASRAPITANENLSNKLYFCLGLLSNLAYILRPVDSISVILGIFYPFYPSLDIIPLVTLDYFLAKKLLVNLMCFELPQKMDV